MIGEKKVSELYKEIGLSLKTARINLEKERKKVDKAIAQSINKAFTDIHIDVEAPDIGERVKEALEKERTKLTAIETFIASRQGQYKDEEQMKADQELLKTQKERVEQLSDIEVKAEKTTGEFLKMNDALKFQEAR